MKTVKFHFYGTILVVPVYINADLITQIVPSEEYTNIYLVSKEIPISVKELESEVIDKLLAAYKDEK